MKKNRLAIIGTNGLPGRYGGWDQLLEHLTKSLNEEYEVIVYSSNVGRSEILSEYNGCKIKTLSLNANGWQSILYDGLTLFHSAFARYENTLVLGTSGCIFFPLIRLISKNLILNPDGAEWQRGKWNSITKKYLKFSELLGVNYADVVIADNLVIKEYIKSNYKIDSILIEYGGDHVVKVPMSKLTEDKYCIRPGNYSFKVCRIVPENNLDIILNAFRKSDQVLVVVGNWNFSEYGRDLKRRYSVFNNLKLIDPIYDQLTLDELRGNCKFYIHGHSVGGTNPSLVEAMSLGLCCIVYDVNYNRETTNNAAVYFKNEVELLCAIEELELDASAIDEKCINLKREANRRYKWDRIVAEYRKLFISNFNE